MFNRDFCVHNIRNRAFYGCKLKGLICITMMYKLFIALLIVGGLNWGLIGILNFDLVAFIFGSGSLLSRIVYTIVGISAICSIPALFSSTDSDNGAM